jgi:hypothetical protein
MPSCTVEARRFRAGDEELLWRGIERARSGIGANEPVRALDELRWRYGDAPHGACVAFALDERGEAVAGIAATRHRARLEGSEVFWLEVGDLFNDFARGSGLARARPLLDAGRAFAETFGGFAPEKHPVMYGTPGRRAHRIGLKHLDWEVLRSENELALGASRTLPTPARDVLVEEVARFPSEVERVFLGFAEGRAAVLVRDQAYLDWRYADRPDARFERGLARRAGEIVGYAVQREGRLLDLCARADDENAIVALLGWARARSRAGVLAMVVPDTAPEWLLLQRLGFRARGTREYLCFRSFQRPAIMSWLFHHWSYSRGDTLR